MKFGVTFSEPYASSLGLRPAEVYRSLIHEIGLEVIRLCVYWDRTEPRPGKFDFDSVDRQVDAAAKAGLRIVLAVGQKAPRWPEFHIPAWTSTNDPDFERHLLHMMESVVGHFKSAPISIWQVENEPYLAFGGPPLEEGLLRREIELVRSLDDRPVMLTDSADKGDWAVPAQWCDILGVNLYTRLWDGRRYADIKVAPARYKAKIRSVSSSVMEVIVSELQAEPWGPRGMTELTPSEAAVTMNPDSLRRNVEIAASAGFDTVLFWGGEWWYWLRERGEPSMWEMARSIVEELAWFA
jgi:GH35 family endo-1,4-beta-xylanase